MLKSFGENNSKRKPTVSPKPHTVNHAHICPATSNNLFVSEHEMIKECNLA